MAVKLAADIGDGLTKKQVETCKEMAAEVQGLATLFWAVAPHDIASLVAGTCGISELDEVQSMLVFENETDRDSFVRDQDEAEIPDIHFVCAELTERYQRKLIV